MYVFLLLYMYCVWKACKLLGDLVDVMFQIQGPNTHAPVIIGGEGKRRGQGEPEWRRRLQDSRGKPVHGHCGH